MPEITRKFKDGLSLNESNGLINIDENFFTQGLNKSLNELKKVREYSYKLENYNKSDIEILKDIVSLCKDIKISIDNKQKDWDL